MTNDSRPLRARLAEGEAEREAKRLMEANPQLSFGEALDDVLRRRPELYSDSVR